MPCRLCWHDSCRSKCWCVNKLVQGAAVLPHDKDQHALFCPFWSSLYSLMLAWHLFVSAWPGCCLYCCGHTVAVLCAPAGLAGAVSRTATAPVDRLKMLLQVQEGRRMSIREGMRLMSAEGGWQCSSLCQACTCAQRPACAWLRREGHWCLHKQQPPAIWVFSKCTIALRFWFGSRYSVPCSSRSILLQGVDASNVRCRVVWGIIYQGR